MTGFLTWVRSTLRGEVSTGELTARRGAGTAAYSLIDEAAGAVGDDRGTCLFRACAWNAFALQTIAEMLVDVDAEDDPGTAGYVPQSSLRYASACLDRVPDWIRMARMVQGDPQAQVRALPEKLPSWTTAEPTRRSELHALRTAYEALEARVESDLERLVATAPADARVVVQARRLRAEMQTAADYANALAPRHAGDVDRGEARWRLLSALDSAFALGQLLAVPTLADLSYGRTTDAGESPLLRGASWVTIRYGWPVTDADGMGIGRVERVLGDPDIGAFEGLEIAPHNDAPAMRIPASWIAKISGGEVRLNIRQDDVGKLRGDNP
jgi:hypothetical protein